MFLVIYAKLLLMLATPKRKTARAALLIEVLVCFVLILISSVAFYGLQANSRLAKNKASHLLMANALARQLMEDYANRGYASLQAGSEKGTRTYENKRDGNSSLISLPYKVSIYDGPGQGVKSILVEVSYGTAALSLESYVVN